MSKNNQIHVVPNSERGGWDVKKAGSERASRHYPTKQPAIDKAREMSRNQNGELVIHKKDNTIQKRDSQGNDPFPPKG